MIWPPSRLPEKIPTDTIPMTDTHHPDAEPTTDSPDRSNLSPVDRRTALRGAAGVLLALAGGVGTAAATTDTDTGLQYNEDTTLDDSGASITFSLTNHGSRTIILDIIDLARISIPQMAVDGRGDSTLDISVTGNGHDTRMSNTVNNGAMFFLLDADRQASIPPGETATVVIGPYHTADLSFVGGSVIAYNKQLADLRGETFETPAEITFHYARSSPGTPEYGRYEFTHQSI